MCVTVASNSYSPDLLAPSDFHLFPNTKKELAEKHFDDDNDVISAIEDYSIDCKEETFYATWMQVPQHRHGLGWAGYFQQKKEDF
jgi:hypothetical protein